MFKFHSSKQATGWTAWVNAWKMENSFSFGGRHGAITKICQADKLNAQQTLFGGSGWNEAAPPLFFLSSLLLVCIFTKLSRATFLSCKSTVFIKALEAICRVAQTGVAALTERRLLQCSQWSGSSKDQTVMSALWITSHLISTLESFFWQLHGTLCLV